MFYSLSLIVFILHSRQLFLLWVLEKNGLSRVFSNVFLLFFFQIIYMKANVPLEATRIFLFSFLF